MRIDALQKINQLYQTTKPAKVKQTVSLSERDKVEISTMGKDYQAAKKAVLQSGDIREDKVAALKSKIDAGTYQVSAGDFASKLIEKYNEIY